MTRASSRSSMKGFAEGVMGYSGIVSSRGSLTHSVSLKAEAVVGRIEVSASS